MRAEFDELKKIYRESYFANPDGVISGKEFFELMFDVYAAKILNKLEVCNGMAKFYLFEAVKNDLEFEECALILKRLRSSAA